MRVMLVHNYYLQRGGEDAVFEAESRLLSERGVTVHEYRTSNAQMAATGPAAMAIDTVWNRRQADRLRHAIRQFKPDVVHVHNTFPLLSPAVFHVAKRHGAATVATLHNYRLLCPGVNLFRDGKVCEDCLHLRLKWPGVKHACYRDDRAASAVVATMLGVHDLLGTYRRLVDRFIAPTHFVKSKHVEGGFATDSIVVKPHFLPVDPGAGSGEGSGKRYALFVGRLSAEKGVETLLEAWEGLGDRIELRVVGDGPLRAQVDRAGARSPAIKALGRLDRDGVYGQMKGATLQVIPSECYETFGLVAVEAMATGLPVVASRLGAMAQVVRDGETGRLFEPGVAADLRSTVISLLDRPDQLLALREAARAEFLRSYTAGSNFRALMAVYQSVLRPAPSSP